MDNKIELTGTNREKLLQATTDYDLKTIINELYRNKAVVGDGGTADILMEEYFNGSAKHLQKAIDSIKRIERIINTNNLDLEDLDIAEALIDDLESAIDLFN